MFVNDDDDDDDVVVYIGTAPNPRGWCSKNKHPTCSRRGILILYTYLRAHIYTQIHTRINLVCIIYIGIIYETHEKIPFTRVHLHTHVPILY